MIEFAIPSKRYKVTIRLHILGSFKNISTSFESSSLATNSSSATFRHLVDGFLLHLLLLATCFLYLSSLLFRFDSLSLIFSGFDGLIPLSFSHFRFHISLGQDSLQRSTLDRTLKLNGSSGSPC